MRWRGAASSRPGQFADGVLGARADHRQRLQAGQADAGGFFLLEQFDDVVDGVGADHEDDARRGAVQLGVVAAQHLTIAGKSIFGSPPTALSVS